MDGFFGVYYLGPAGSGAFGLLLSGGNVFGVDVSGGDISGTYNVREDSGIDFALRFSFTPGAVLVTGQTLAQHSVFDSNLSITASTLSGGQQNVQLPFGNVSVRVRKICSL